MNRLNLFLSIVLLAATVCEGFASSFTVRYYRQTRIIAADMSERAGNGGQFITFVENGCYDSDRAGMTVNNGFLRHVQTTSDRVIYQGDSYWGRAMYIFFDNFDVLNVRVEQCGTTYVYRLATAPAGVTTSSLIRQRSGGGGGGSAGGGFVQPPINQPPITQPTVQERRCNACNGTGQHPICNGTGRLRCGACFGSGTRSSTDLRACQVCNGRGSRLCGCNNGVCGACFGRGTHR